VKTLFIYTIFCLFTSSAWAWSVSPMSQEIKQKQRTFQIKINNLNGKTPVALRLKAMARDTDEWGKDKLSNTNDLLVFPRRMMVPAGKKMVARISVRKTNQTPNEKAYRLIVDQIPVKAQAGERGVKVLTRYLTSIYLTPRKSQVQDFKITMANINEQGVEITAINKGNFHKVLLPSSIKVGKYDINSKFPVVNILPGKSIKIMFPIEKRKLETGKKMSFDNTCMVCPQGEKYQVTLQ
jgi:fimbrial chaperone protein